jgi:hypothetical protein
MNESLKAVYTGFHFSHGKRRLPQEFLSGREKPGEATERPAAAVAPFGDSPPLRAGQALGRRSLIPIRPHGGADHSAFGASRLRVQGQDHGLVQPSVGIDYRPVMAVEPSRAVDQQTRFVSTARRTTSGFLIAFPFTVPQRTGGRYDGQVLKTWCLTHGGPCAPRTDARNRGDAINPYSK